MGYSTYFKDTALDSVLTGVYVSLHTGDPGDTGANEVSGGSPAYERKAITLGAASGGVKSATSNPVLDVPGSTTLTHAGFWDSQTSGNFLIGFDIPNETFTNQGTYTVDSATVDMNA